ncbi:phosphohistidine phosphatase SixA [Pseudoalteromonas sp. McH1-7]|uniref:Phosphohistidine phosphatase n=1 Tax=Pseudoalteromonas peptidolytica F12-50-A1 TaxID=1315280 RepID=A0A8I0T2X0_9GAMM|nr:MULTISPECIES: phosphohistidine phosphatase SixA [Pseudoalteromonas]MBE0345360.1 phosphohistidine phosphatase [Pseudoalteromonas peptidolytica F12-50-A1]MDW7547455.1 phosphohistidine phosphatase SixA [Pseudoalteromonas peptidolytica]NLR15907.1 phosphohistidine phosphatase SixA [Pseudoalteromonas peptidolytica]NUZ09844.1 phosphohistidine phosphatase SixA [Pseudoalteromonas sp. McH1-7]RXF01578.1 phosphohistidine phosphatase SixA [Pseudoalteromonas sp. PS5]
MKTILIMRHGEAQAMQADDASRALTQLGLKQAKDMGQWLEQHFKIDAALVSPYTRAQQTAEQVFSFQSPQFVETCADIVPSGSANTATDYLETLISMHPEHQTWLLVAHMPIVSYLVDCLCPDTMPIFSTAAVAVLEYSEETGRAEFISMQLP